MRYVRFSGRVWEWYAHWLIDPNVVGKFVPAIIINGRGVIVVDADGTILWQMSVCGVPKQGIDMPRITSQTYSRIPGLTIMSTKEELRVEYLPSVEPNTPWFVVAVVSGGGEWTILLFKAPEKQSIVGMSITGCWDISCEAATDIKCDIRESFGHLEIWIHDPRWVANEIWEKGIHTWLPFCAKIALRLTWITIGETVWKYLRHSWIQDGKQGSEMA